MSFINRINKKIIAYLLGLEVMVLVFMCLCSLIVSVIYNEETQLKLFAICLFVYLLPASFLLYRNKDYHLPVAKKDGQILIGLLWILIPLFGALPYALNFGKFSIVDAIFESFSGFTTTGSSIITDLSSMPKSILFYRSLSQWVGGLGFAVVIILTLKSRAGQMMNIFNAEFSSVYKNRMYPHLSDVALRIAVVYTSLTVICFCLLNLGSMNVFQAICHSFSTIATGGFSTENNNIGAFHDDYTIYVITIMMFLSGISYFVFVRLFKGDFKVLKDNQFIAFILYIILTSALFVVYTFSKGDVNVAKNIKNALFYVVSILTTTGYDIQGYGNHIFISTMLIFLMFIGGCSASSASGLKIIRVIQIIRYARATMNKIFHPHALIPIRYNGRAIEDGDMKNTLGFFFLYISIFVAGVFLLSCFGNGFSMSITLSIANLGNIGPVVGGYIHDFSYAWLNIPSKFVLIILMIIGRLEIFAFFALLSKSLWKRN
ncbi:MAG: TrkH family potassium uptake protein [Bacteroidales bacterium]|nr:TrkH family potassium uptake protein [Bacteroidales bacterium]